MIMRNKKIIVLLMSLFIWSYAYSDSPITSTFFSAAYKDVPIVQAASKSKGILTSELMGYIDNSSNPIDIKVAIINELGWNFDGKTNHILFFQYLKNINGYSGMEDFIIHASGDELLCFAYLKAMDNYFDVEDAISIANHALERSPKSYTFNIIVAILEAQNVRQNNWCHIYKLSNRVRINKALKMDMRSKAAAIIYEYMDLYKDYCQNSE